MKLVPPVTESEPKFIETGSEQAFDDLALLAASVCGTPKALVSFVDKESAVGPQSGDELFVVTDTQRDNRFAQSPLLTNAPFIRFYAGAPFHAVTGEVLGSLCVIDTEPRPAGLTELQANGLRNLARQVSILLDMRRAIAERDVLATAQREAEARHLALLQLGDRLREITTMAEMTLVATRSVGEVLQLSRVGFSPLDGGGFYQSGTARWVAEGSAADGHERQDAAVLHMPVRERGRVVGALVLHDDRPRGWSPEVIAFLGHVIDRVESGLARLKADAEQHVLN
ncbi:MAG TPA: GAF domain-containing protein, partial [Myxococcales bacterium]|nr:GAF domain-containing protein [Myxococcales bacterium]